MTESATGKVQRESVILLVDDNPANLGVVATGLEQKGYRVLVAEDGIEALERAKRIVPDLILLDVMMPGIDGFEVCRRLKADAATSAIPVIFMTVLTAMKDKLTAFEAGAVDYVTKPLYVEEVVARVGTQLELAAYRDNLERLVAERTAELAARERELRTLVENAPDFITRFDNQCRHIFANPQFETSFGISIGEHLGRTPVEVYPGNQDVAAYQACIAQVIINGQSTEFELAIPDLNKEARYYNIHLVAERDIHGQVAGVLAIGRDITVLKETERRLEKSNDQLRAMARRRETAREEERKHVARELHDELGQYLTALRLNASVVNLEFADRNPALRKKLEQLLSIVDSTKKVARNLSQRLRPAELDMGTETALNELADQFNAQYGISCNLELDEETDKINHSYSVILYRVLQESLTNIARHAEARSVEVVLQRGDDEVVLMIRDDGMGFDPSQVKNTSFGLVGMRERLLAVGGELEVSTELHNGTRVVAHLPNVEGEQGASK